MFKDTLNPKKERKFEAYIGNERSWWDYYRHYKTAVDYLVEGIEKNVAINTVSLPLVFLIRHCLELVFKAHILKLEMVSKARPPLDIINHDLEELFAIFRDHLLQIIEQHKIPFELIERIKQDLKKTEKLKQLFHRIDQGSYNFRYPVNKKGKQNFKASTRLNVADITKAFYGIQPFLVFVDTVLEEHGVFQN